MAVLTAYVREQAPRPEEDTHHRAEKPPPNIQAILTVLGRRETTGKDRGTDRLDLSGTRLVRADLTDANLSKALLNEAKNLTAEQVRSGADWREAYLPEDLQDLPD